MATTEPVLSLSTVVDRHTIKIDGKSYELRNPDELTWLAYRQKANDFREVGKLLQVKRRTKAQEAALDRLLPPLVEKLVIAPKPVLAKLRPEHQFAIVTVFSTLLVADLRTRAGAKTAHGRSRVSTTKTGAK